MIRRIFIIVILGLTVAACSGIDPWVKPYERANLADEAMKPSRDPVSDSYMNHVHEAREGARGASGSAGGGCGCN